MKPSVSELIPTNGYFPLRIHVIPQKILGASLLELSPQLVSNGRTQILSLSLFSPIKCTLSLHLVILKTSLVAQTVKRLSTMWETWLRSLGWEVPWRRKWQPTPVLLPRKSHGQRSLVSMGSQRVGHD